MKPILFVLCILFLFGISNPATAQDCLGPEGVLGDMAYNAAYGAFQGCTQTGWQAFHLPVCPDGDECAGTADAFAFTDVTDAAIGTQIESNIIQISGLTGTGTVTITGDGSPEFRICSASDCSTEITAWGSSAQDINTGDYLQLRLNSSAGDSTLHSATVTINGTSDQWDVTTAAPLANCTLDGETVAHGASYTFYSVEESTNCAGNSQSRTCTDGTLDGSASFQYASCDTLESCTLDGETVAHGASFTFYSVEESTDCAGNSQSRTCTDGTLDGSASFQYASCDTLESCTLDGQTVNHGASYTFYSTEESANCAGSSQSRTCTDGTLDGSSSFQYASCSPPVSCAGTEVNGYCMYAGADEQSCTQVCSTRGGCNIDGVTWAAANTDNCRAAQDALGLGFGSVTENGPGMGLGCMFYMDMMRMMDGDGMLPLSCNASFNSTKRVCACGG